MDSRQEAREQLAALTEGFRQLEARGDLAQHAEATARTWIERFLVIFGWDPADPRQVRQEYRIQGRAARRLKSEGTRHRRPDYCLMANGRRTLYIDAKKFAADLRGDASIAYQVRCYGWSEGFRVSYAFDLDELAVYDCRVRPNGDDAADVARLLYLSHDQYLGSFDLLWQYLSREEVESGSLERLHPDDAATKGTRTLDQDFEDRLTEWRRALAVSIMRYGKTRDAQLISGASQRIIDRIVFLRMCEEFGLEELGSLKEMSTDEDGFWARFLEENERRYSRLYDGMLFPAQGEDDPTGIDVHMRTWSLKGRIFREIVEGLYFPNPYRFDVIPIELLGGIYERYLGKRLKVVGNEITNEFKPEYQRTKGAIYTPPWIVERVIAATIGPLIHGKPPQDVLKLRVVDPACGSGGFLLGAFDYLESAILAWFRDHPNDASRASLVFRDADGERLAPGVARSLVTECLFGVDIDPAAVEVARMSLALRYLDRTASVEDGGPSRLLDGIGKNIRQGNSLVGPDVVGLGLTDAAEAVEAMPFDWSSQAMGFGTRAGNGSFDAVVGNPPYIEVKRYREWMPAMYRYLREGGQYKTTTQGKVDVSIPFIERGVRLLKPGGRLGFIIQNRFFKTEYGSQVRAWLAAERLIESIEDFRDLQVFPGRTTYTAIMVCRKSSQAVSYTCYSSVADAQGSRALVRERIDYDSVSDEPWSFDQPDLLAVHTELGRRVGTIGSHGVFQINVGLQTLWGKLYQLQAEEIKPRTISAVNGFGEKVILEKAALRPLCRNRAFYPFRVDNADAWVIFPYDVAGEEYSEIRWSQFEERFPRTAAYLQENKRRLLKAVETEAGNRWHLYQYPKNLVEQTRSKVLFPSTIEDTIASVDADGSTYQDNVRINSLTLAGATTEQLMAVAAVINSSPFNALARLKAGLSDSGWRQLNRQFAQIVPFPRAVLDDPVVASRLAELARKITEYQEHAVRDADEGTRGGLRAILDSLWSRLDEAVEDAYGLTVSEREVVRRYPRRLSRFDLLVRQAVPPEDEE